jgi:hypothetical protein
LLDGREILLADLQSLYLLREDDQFFDILHEGEEGTADVLDANIIQGVDLIDMTHFE